MEAKVYWPKFGDPGEIKLVKTNKVVVRKLCSCRLLCSTSHPSRALGRFTLHCGELRRTNRLHCSRAIMAIGDLFHTMSALMETCKKQVSHVARRLRSHPSLSKLTAVGTRKDGGRGGAPFLHRGASLIPFLSNKRITDDKKRHVGGEEEEEAGGVWQKTILMGEKCQPLDFSGAIHYDSSGRQLSSPRTPLRTPMTSFAFHEEEDEEEFSLP
ncbi:unnamed protein product [Musa acuminata var. zebrina]